LMPLLMPMWKWPALPRQLDPASLGLALVVSFAVSGCGGGGGDSDPLPGSVPSAVRDQLMAESAALKLTCPHTYAYYGNIEPGGGTMVSQEDPTRLEVINVSFTAMSGTVSPVKMCVTSPTQDEVPAAVLALAPRRPSGWTRVEMVGNIDGMKNKQIDFGSNYLAPLAEARKSAEAESIYGALPDGQGGWTWQKLPTTRSYNVPSDLPSSTQVKFEAPIPGPGYYILY
jgi:hypothetical protein